MYQRYAEIEKNETLFEEYKTSDAEIVITAYGTVGRICKSVVDTLRQEGIKAGFIRPITVYPFPAAVYERVASQPCVKKFLTVELSMGQMIEDVRLSVNGKKPVEFYGRSGGNITSEEEIAKAAKEALNR